MNKVNTRRLTILNSVLEQRLVDVAAEHGVTNERIRQIAGQGVQLLECTTLQDASVSLGLGIRQWRRRAEIIREGIRRAMPDASGMEQRS